MTRRAQWQGAIAFLRKNFPSEVKVRIRTIQLPKKTKRVAGYTQWDGKQFHIIVEKRDCYRLKIDTLLHEWAHVLSWDDHDTDQHGEKWGLTYSRLYRAYLEWSD